MENYLIDIQQILREPLILEKLFERPKAKPWDYAKGKRFRCCGGMLEHRPYCLFSVTEITIPKMGRIESV